MVVASPIVPYDALQRAVALKKLVEEHESKFRPLGLTHAVEAVERVDAGKESVDGIGTWAIRCRDISDEVYDKNRERDGMAHPAAWWLAESAYWTIKSVEYARTDETESRRALTFAREAFNRAKEHSE